jgi:hypothetical protein
MGKNDKISLNRETSRGWRFFIKNKTKNEAVQLELVPERHCFGSGSADLAVLDLDPYWECGYGSRTKNLTKNDK